MDPDTRFRRLFELAYPRLCRYARNRGLTGPDADDRVAQTLEVAWRRLEDVPADDPLPWLYALRESDQEILRLIAWDGLTPAQAAVVLGCGPEDTGDRGQSRPNGGTAMTATDDDLLTALRAARPDPGYRPSPDSAEATAMLASVLARSPGTTASRGRHRAGRDRGVAVLRAARGQLSAATVRAAVLDALEQHSGDILQISAVGQVNGGEGPSSSSQWLYPAFPAIGQQVRLRTLTYVDGQPVQDVESSYIEDAAREQFAPGGVQGLPAVIVGVDYQTRTWASYTATTFPGNPALSPALIRSEIASGHFTLDGTVRLNGRDAVKLSWRERLAGVGPTLSTVTLWVDARTYVPLREGYVLAQPER